MKIRRQEARLNGRCTSRQAIWRPPKPLRLKGATGPRCPSGRIGACGDGHLTFHYGERALDCVRLSFLLPPADPPGRLSEYVILLRWRRPACHLGRRELGRGASHTLYSRLHLAVLIRATRLKRDSFSAEESPLATGRATTIVLGEPDPVAWNWEVGDGIGAVRHQAGCSPRAPGLGCRGALCLFPSHAPLRPSFPCRRFSSSFPPSLLFLYPGTPRYLLSLQGIHCSESPPTPLLGWLFPALTCSPGRRKEAQGCVLEWMLSGVGICP